MRTVLLTIFAALTLHAGDGNPILRWLVNPAAATTSDPALRAILPNVHSVRVEGRQVLVESAGLSLQSLGPLQTNDREISSGARRFVFRFPLGPKPAEGARREAPLGVVGVFLNGVPFDSPISTISYGNQDLWHRDTVATLDGGLYTATGRAEPGQHGTPQSALLKSLLESSTRHSPLIGFALDGYPIYGPYGWDRDGTVRRFHSSYRLRTITRRATLPDGTELTPSQEGPPVSAEFPLGTFVEDYEYLPGSGDLDAHNGRFARTPEYPQGTYAYFLSTDERNQLTYPYLVGPAYYGHVDAPQPVISGTTQHQGRVDLTTPTRLDAGHSVKLIFCFRDSRGRRIRFLEKVHEQPIHLLVVSADLSDFSHIHPVLQPDETYAVDHTFSSGGTYWLFADHTPPGGSQTVSRFCLDVQGAASPPQTLQPDGLTRTSDGLRVKLTHSPLLTGQDLDFRFDVSDASTDLPVHDLEPYLGAWAHIVMVSQDHRNFIHAHPLDDASAPINTNPWVHTHAAPGPSPASVSTITGFRTPGLYRLWIQFQRQGNVITFPFTFRVEAGETSRQAAPDIPPGAIHVRVSQAGFEPARITATAGKPVVLAFDREDAQNCVNTVVFPELGIRKTLPAGRTVVISIPTGGPSGGPREYHFVCGMNMYRGSLVIR